MNLKKRLHWISCIIFSLFVMIVFLVQTYGTYSLLTSKITSHNNQLKYLIETGNTAEQVFNQLAAAHNYERFSMTSPEGETFRFVAESAINWPLITKLLGPTPLGPRQTFITGGVSTMYQLDFSPMLRREQQLLLTLIAGGSVFYIFYSLMVNFVIRRYITKPTDNIAQAMIKMSKFHFGASEPHGVIDEMKTITPALKKMSIAIGDKYNELTTQNRQLKQEAFHDELTGYGNRVLFNKELNLLLNSEPQFVQAGLLCFIHTTQLEHLNTEQGFKAGDEYISKIAQYLDESLSNMPSAQIYRINGADFAVLLPNQAEASINLFTDGIKTRFDDYQNILDVESIAYTGIVKYCSGDTLSDILSSVDAAVSIAQTLQTNGYYLHDVTKTQGNKEWQNTVTDVLQNPKITLLHQPIIPTTGDKPLYIELFARFYDKNNHELATQSLIAMAARHGNAIAIDKLIITNITEAIQAGHLKGLIAGIKLTTSSVLSRDFLIWLERHLIANSEVARQVIFEVSSNTVEQNHQHTKKLIAILHKCGAKFSLTHFGITALSFKQLKTLKPNFVKLDRSLTNELLHDKDNQFYIKQLVDVAHHLHIKIIIVGIETQEERFFVEGLRVDGIQGYFLHKPKNILELTTSVCR